MESADPGRLRWVTSPREITREQWLTRLAAVLALGAASPIVYDSLARALASARGGAWLAMLGSLALMGLAALLIYGAMTYFLARLGHLTRLRAAIGSEPADAIVTHDPHDRSSLAVLIPSYREDPDVVLRTLMSAALQPHPGRRVVLLIDDPSDSIPGDGTLKQVRALPAYVQAALQPIRRRCERAMSDFETRVGGEDFDFRSEARRLAQLCRHAAAWFDEQARIHGGPDYATLFFSSLTFSGPAARWRHEANSWDAVAGTVDAPFSIDGLRSVYALLLTVFTVEITSFERKRFANLSHAPSKAMNINSYLSLLGGSYRYAEDGDRLVLSRCPDPGADLVVPDAEFVLILDADTIVSSDYVSKLLRRFRSPGGERLAIVQSPYSTFQSDRGVLQRIAGAQTDVQYLIHQGLTHYNATYWVGANALVRVAALRELAVAADDRDGAVIKFICDRTLIEDTESTIELATRGWLLFNHLERLAFSMTPPDFGSLLIQRQRWANGGLLIVPKLWRYLRQPGPIRERLKEGFMRLHYLISLGPVSMALLVALGVSWDQELRTGGLLGTGLVYYAMYARDLHLLGYRWHDIFRVIALNIVLIPVNLVGMLSSVTQGITGRKARFTRTPKVHGRTRVPALYAVSELVLVGLWSAHALVSLTLGALLVTVFMAVHALFAVYAIGAFIGFRETAGDIAAFRGSRPALIAPPPRSRRTSRS